MSLCPRVQLRCAAETALGVDFVLTVRKQLADSVLHQSLLQPGTAVPLGEQTVRARCWKFYERRVALAGSLPASIEPSPPHSIDKNTDTRVQVLAVTLGVVATHVIGGIIVLVINLGVNEPGYCVDCCAYGLGAFGNANSPKLVALCSCELKLWLILDVVIAFIIGLFCIWAHRKIHQDEEGKEIRGHMARMQRGCNIFLVSDGG